MRQDLLDQIVWTEVMRLVQDPALIEQELDRRLAAARAADPTKQREQTIQRELVRVGKGIERLLTAYQEELLTLEQLQERMPALRQREPTHRTELHALAEQTRDRAAYLHLAETLSAFLTRLRLAADTLDILERQRIVRLVVKEVPVGDDTIVIRHSIPVPSGPPGGSSPPRLGGSDDVEPTEVTSCVRGVEARWRGDGKEIYFLSLDATMMVVDVATGPRPTLSAPRPLFEAGVLVNPRQDHYAVSRDGQRFLVKRPVSDGRSRLTVVLNWKQALKAPPR